MTQIRTQRLILRDATVDDAHSYAAGVGEFEVARFLTPVPHPYTLAMAVDWLGKAPPSTPERSMLMIDLPDQSAIGCISLADELGFWIARPHWNKGYVTEAATALLDWHFGETTARSVSCSAHHDNVASLAVQKKLGFLPTGHQMRYSQTLQRNVDHLTHSLSRAHWQDRKDGA
nr:GNAT family N-acetyltransferase [uncultured Devosia sp.]